MALVTVYACQVCGTSLAVPHGSAVPQHCAAPMKWRQTRDYKPEEHGWETGMKSAAIGFRNTSPWMVPIGGPNGETETAVTSLRQIRQIERESEQAERNGEGQAMRFRAFSQQHHGSDSMYKNTFGEPPQRAPQLFDAQGRQKISFEAVDGEPVEAEMGPGADESLASALPSAPGQP